MLRAAAALSCNLHQQITYPKSSTAAKALAAAVQNGVSPLSNRNKDNEENQHLNSCRQLMIGATYKNVSTSTFLLASSSSVMPRRNMSTTAGSGGEGDETTTISFNDVGSSPSTPNPTFEESMSKLIPSPSKPIPSEEEVAANLAERAAQAWDPTWYNLPDQVINLVNYIHEVTDISYGLSIVGLTLGLRMALFPLFVKSQQNIARMAHMRPEMEVLNQKINQSKKTTNVNAAQKEAHQAEMKALFKKYGWNPFASAIPFVQMPVFASMFFGLRKMPQYFPNELATGGMLWFPDLAAADPYLAMPILSAGSFMLMIHLGREQMMASNPDQGKKMMGFFYAMGFIMVPATMNFPTAVFCYWSTNNLFSLGQTLAFKNATIRKKLNIWDPPKPVPGLVSKDEGIVEGIKGYFKENKEKQEKESMAYEIKKHNEMIEQKKMERIAAAAASKGDNEVAASGGGGGRKRKKGRGRRK